MATKTFQRSFAAGVISPELYSRLDLRHHQTGLAQAINFWTLPHGPVQNRPGFRYVLRTRDSSKAVRLIPFEYSTEQTFVLEFGHEYIRFHTQGGTLLEDAIDISSIAGNTVSTDGAHGFSAGDWVFIGSSYHKVTSTPDTGTFTVTDLWDKPVVPTGTTAARVYTIASPYDADDLFALTYTQSADVLTICHPGYAPRELRRQGATSWDLSTINFEPTIAAPGAPSLSTNGSGGTSSTHSYVVTAVANGTQEESLASPPASEDLDLTISGNYILVDPPAVTGAVRYNIYKLFNGLYGYIGQTDGSAFKDNNVAPDVSKTPALLDNPFSGAGNYPGAVGYGGGRRVFAGTDNKPQSYWLTRSGTESNLSYSIPTRDDDMISGTIKARQVHRIRHILPLQDLAMLTSGGEWILTPQNSDILTPASADPDNVNSEGANFVTPIIAGTTALYVEALGSHVRALDYFKDKFGNPFLDPRDISIMAPHLFDGYTLVDAAYRKKPYRMCFWVRGDGALLGLTYLPEHEVQGWHVHETTNGAFESVAAVAEGTEMALYAIVKREINGETVRYVECLSTRRFENLEDCFFVDSGLTYSGTATTTITGLDHLEGETVAILADGGVVGERVVTRGKVTLDNAASLVHVGLPIRADAQTLPPGLEINGFGQGNVKNVSRVHLRVHESSGIKVGPEFDKLRELPVRSNEPWGTPPARRSGTVSLSLDNKWSTEGQVCVRQDAPLPITISSMTLEVAVGG